MNIKELNQLLSYLDRQYSINSGGCCYVAYLLAINLERLGIKFKLVVNSDNHYDASLLRKNIRNVQNNKHVQGCGRYTFNHYYIKVGNHYINRGHYGVTTVIKNVTAKDILNVYKSGCWNDYYSTSNNPFIAKKISKFFLNYEKEKAEKN